MDISQNKARIDWYKPVLCRFYALITKSTVELFKLNILAFIRVLLFIPINIPLNSSKIILISYYRSDLLKDFNAIINFLSKDHVEVTIKPYQRIKLFRVYIDDIAFSYRESSKIIARVSEKPRNNTLARGIIFFSMLEGLKIIRHLEEKNISVDSVLSLMEMQFYENVICQYYKLTGARTFAYQHGFYHDVGSSITKKSHIPVNYLASVCDTALVWGATSKDVMERYFEANIVCVGKPNLLGLSSGLPRVSENDVSEYPHHLVAILDHSAKREANILIMEAISESICDSEIISFIAHPDDAYDYSGFNANRVSHDVLNRDQHCIVANNSSAILQYGRAGYSVLLYDKSSYCKYFTQDELGAFPITKRRALSFYELDKSSSEDFWCSFIYKYGHECLELIASSVRGK